MDNLEYDDIKGCDCDICFEKESTRFCIRIFFNVKETTDTVEEFLKGMET